jgi:hypothetical protein
MIGAGYILNKATTRPTPGSLYTGPCFMLYNNVLRGMGNPEQPGVVPAHDEAFGGTARGDRARGVLGGFIRIPWASSCAPPRSPHQMWTTDPQQTTVV